MRFCLFVVLSLLWCSPLWAQNGPNAWPTVIQDLRQGQSPTLLEDGSRLITRSAYDMLLESEVGGGQQYYDKYLTYPTWPKEKSGVTIGVGYDLGYVTKETFFSDWTPFLAGPELQRLATCIGVTGSEAQRRAKTVATIRIPWESARIVFITRTLPRCYLETMSAFPGFEQLPPDAQGAIVSLVLNRGVSMEGTTREEMAEIREYVRKGDLTGIASAMRHMKHLWVGHGVDGLIRRREDEASLVERSGLGYHVASYIALPPLDGTPPVATYPTPFPSDSLAAQVPISETIQTPAVFTSSAPTPPPMSHDLRSSLDILGHLADPMVRQQVQNEENVVLNLAQDEAEAQRCACQLLQQINETTRESHQRRLVKLYTTVQEDVAWLQQNRHLLVAGSEQGNTVTIDLTDMDDLDGCPPTMEKRLLAIARLAIVQAKSTQPTWSAVEYDYSNNQDKPKL